MSLHLDFETYSDLDLPQVGAFRYAEHASTKALILGYSLDETFIAVDLTKPGYLKNLVPVFNAIERGIEVCAHNATFERLIWERMFKDGLVPIKPKPEQWDCTAARARMLALPGSLDGTALALELGMEKDPEGQRLMNIFSKPNSLGERVLPTDNPKAFEAFMDYCLQDVRMEKAIDQILPKLSSIEKKCFTLDFKINARGMPVNVPLVEKTAKYVEEYSEGILDKSFEISKCKPTQVRKVMDYLATQGYEVPNLQALTVEALAKKPGLPKQVLDLLEYRIEISRSGTKKLKTIMQQVSDDGRLRGCFLYSAASTRRWSSRGVQVHNLSKPEGETNPDIVMQTLAKDPEDLELMFSRPLTSIAQSIRGFFQAEKHFLVADYASIEPRGLAWSANEEWLLEAYRNKEDAYRIAASRVYGIPVSSISKDSIYRFLGKQLILGCGYGMGAPRFIETCAKFGQSLTEAEAFEAVQGYRSSVPNIKAFWYDVEKACIKAVKYWRIEKVDRFTFRPETLPNGFRVLFVDMPSGSICYPKPSVGISEWNGELKDVFEFYTPLGSSWIKTDTFGGSIVENLIQALTRDVLRDGLIEADRQGFDICGHVHDEGIAEGENNKEDLKAFELALCSGSEWSEGLPIETEGYIHYCYKK
jgi:DNA polymerase